MPRMIRLRQSERRDGDPDDLDRRCCEDGYGECGYRADAASDGYRYEPSDHGSQSEGHPGRHLTVGDPWNEVGIRSVGFVKSVDEPRLRRSASEGPRNASQYCSDREARGGRREAEGEQAQQARDCGGDEHSAAPPHVGEAAGR